jgi:cell filamentation protein
MSRYIATGSQGDFEPGSGGLVLKNRLGIVLPEDMDDAELTLLAKLYEEVLIERLPAGRITVAHLKAWHKRWLGNVYEWAGEERSVNVGKDGFQFAIARQIPSLLEKLDADHLALYTRRVPISPMSN